MLELFPYQKKGAAWLFNKSRALLADEPGVGKTPQVIRALGPWPRDVLVVAPAVALGHWEREFERWQTAPHNVEIVSYDTLRRHKDEYTSERWSHLILDECHFLKNMQAQRTRAILARGGVAWHADNIWALSGTPAPNNYAELFPYLKTFGAWKGTYNDFANRYCHVDQFNRGRIFGNKRKPELVAELRQMLEPIMMRRRKKEVLKDLPEMMVTEFSVHADPAYLSYMYPVDEHKVSLAASIQAGEVKEALENLDEEARGAWLRANFDSLATMRMYTELCKVAPACELIDFEMENGLLDKVVVFAYHRAAVVGLRDTLRSTGHNVATVWGGTDAKKRDREVERFKRWNKGVFIGQIQAAGTAIDLSCAHQGIMTALDWTPGNNAQAMQRMHRVGQDKSVTIRTLVIKDSVDELISQTLSRKIQDLANLFDGGDS